MHQHSQQQTHHIHQDVTFASLDVLVGIKATFPFGFGGFDTLAVQDGCTWLYLSSRFGSHRLAEGIIHLFPAPFLAPGSEVTVDRLPRWEVVSKHAPGTTATKHVEDGIDDFTHADGSRTTPGFGSWYQGFKQTPFYIGHITGVGFGFHTQRLSPRAYPFQTPSESAFCLLKEVKQMEIQLNLFEDVDRKAPPEVTEKPKPSKPTAMPARFVPFFP